MIRKLASPAAVVTVAGCSAGGSFEAPRASEAVSDPATVKVEYVIDGDTVIVDDDGEEQRVRFLGIDAPEIAHDDGEADEPCGVEAREKVEELTAGGSVELRADDRQPEEDRYGRRLAYVEAGGKDLSAELLAAGLAETFHAADDIARFDEYESLHSQAPRPECAQ